MTRGRRSTVWSGARRKVTAALTALALAAGCTSGTTREQVDLPQVPRPQPMFFEVAPVDPPLRSNSDMIRDYLDLMFRLETGHRLERLTRVEGPITVRINGTAPTTFLHDFNALRDRLAREAGITLIVTEDPAAKITINLITQAALTRLQPRAACFVVPNQSDTASLGNLWRPARNDWRNVTTRDQIALVIPSDAPPQEVRDCLHEELAQGLGPLNDLYRLPDSVFNDDNVHTVLTGFDMLMLRITYAPELRSGMSRDEVARALPALFRRLNPAGEHVQSSPLPITTGRWAKSLNAALGPGSSAAARDRAALRALDEARTQGWQDHRLAFSYYLAGRSALNENQLTARNMINAADRIYASSPLYRLPRARTQGQLAALDIESGEPAEAIARLNPAIKTARAYQNATLLTELLVLKSEALLELGQAKAAMDLRLDTLGWASYGYGKSWANYANVQIVPYQTSQTN